LGDWADIVQKGEKASEGYISEKKKTMRAMTHITALLPLPFFFSDLGDLTRSNRAAKSLWTYKISESQIHELL
jgi:hypothetical protein